MRINSLFIDKVIIKSRDNDIVANINVYDTSKFENELFSRLNYISRKDENGVRTLTTVSDIWKVKEESVDICKELFIESLESMSFKPSLLMEILTNDFSEEYIFFSDVQDFKNDYFKHLDIDSQFALAQDFGECISARKAIVVNCYDCKNIRMFQVEDIYSLFIEHIDIDRLFDMNGLEEIMEVMNKGWR